jgi:hypothetical protein
MSETQIIEREEATGRFLKGTKPGPGRPVGSRSKLGEAFLEDLRDAWLEHGATALARCAVEEPGQFCRIVAGLLPKDINLNVAVNPADFAMKFRHALELLHGDDVPEQLPARQMKVINAR